MQLVIGGLPFGDFSCLRVCDPLVFVEIRFERLQKRRLADGKFYRQLIGYRQVNGIGPLGKFIKNLYNE
jgi:hypothetical protein